VNNIDRFRSDFFSKLKPHKDKFTLCRASGKVREKLEEIVILFQKSVIFAKKCEKVQFWPQSVK